MSPWKYDVFVSFRGEDIRKSFVDHLFKDFKQNGIRAFRDYMDLPRGEEISPHLYKAIENSRFLVVIFSKNYASSSWCLRELVKILNAKQLEKPKHEVRVLFYDVKPGVVRKQTDSYEEAFVEHEASNRAEVDKWREALSMAANLSGWELDDMTNGYESKFIECISKDIHKMLCDVPLDVGENLVGVDARLSKLDLERFIGSCKVNMIGICGISGIGKTTLAKAIYNSMYVYFEGSFFCEDVQGVTKRHDITQVQTQFINKIMKTEDVKITGKSEGVQVIKQRVAFEPILVVLDDVDHHEQLEALAVRYWFCPGSLIIFTAKDKQLLKSHGVNEIHEMEFLDDREDIELFCLYAFHQKYPTHDFKELSYQVVKCLQGHPLTLQVVGNALFEKPVRKWRSELDKLQIYPDSEIHQKLRPSFDLLDIDQKRIFLDIACSLTGENRDLCARVLDNINCFADTNIDVLVNKSLITISPDDSLQMHELIRRMARKVLREESDWPIRLWGASEVYAELGENNLTKATKEVEVLVLLLEKSTKKVHIDCKAFSKMKKLRILKICYPQPEDSQESLQLMSKSTDFSVNFSGSLDFLSNELRLIYWHGYPFKFLPSCFYPENVVAIDLSFSNIQSFWTTPKCFKSLKVMKLRHCRNLTTTPDLTEIVNLEKLNLEGCVSLVKLHPSIGMLKKLVMLNMRGCIQIRSFPCKVKMDSLEVLILAGCLKMDNVTQVSGTINNLVKLFVYGTTITEFPFFEFISSQTNLRVLEIGGFRQTESPTWWPSIFQKQPQSLVLPSLASLRMLTELKLSNCNISEVCDDIGALSCLQCLDLSHNNFTKLPGSLGQLSRLQRLVLRTCRKLEVLPELPPSIEFLRASGCTSLQEPPRLIHRQRFLDWRFMDCPKMFGNVTIDSQVSIQCYQFSFFIEYLGIRSKMREFWRGHKTLLIYLPGKRRIPGWFRNKSKGSHHVKVELPLNWCFSNFKGFGFCVVYKLKESCHYVSSGISVNNFDGAPLFICPEMVKRKYEPGGFLVFCLIMTRDRKWEKAKNFVTFTFGDNNYEVVECGVRLVCDGDEDLKEEEETVLNVIQQLSPTSGLFLLEDGGVRTHMGF